jgi:hypothetical protein
MKENDAITMKLNNSKQIDLKKAAKFIKNGEVGSWIDGINFRSLQEVDPEALLSLVELYQDDISLLQGEISKIKKERNPIELREDAISTLLFLGIDVNGLIKQNAAYKARIEELHVDLIAALEELTGRKDANRSRRALKKI